LPQHYKKIGHYPGEMNERQAPPPKVNGDIQGIREKKRGHILAVEKEEFSLKPSREAAQARKRKAEVQPARGQGASSLKE